MILLSLHEFDIVHQNNEYFGSHYNTLGNRSLTLAEQNIRKLFNDAWESRVKGKFFPNIMLHMAYHNVVCGVRFQAVLDIFTIVWFGQRRGTKQDIYILGETKKMLPL